MHELFELFRSFFRIGLFTFGGGYAMIPLIQAEVERHPGWQIGRDEFIDLLTLAQSVPGPIALNTAVFIGYKSRGYAGAVATTLGIVVPSFVIILLIALLFADIRHNPVVDAAFKGMRPAVVALIIGPVLSLARGMHWAMLFVIAGTALAVWYLGWSPIYILLTAALAGIGWVLFTSKKPSNKTTDDIPPTLYQLSENRLLRLRRRLRHAVAHPERGGGPARLAHQRRIRRHRGRLANHARPHRHQLGHLRRLLGRRRGRQPWFGLLGAFIATFAVCMPSLTLMLLLTRFFLRLHNNPLVEGAMKGMRPVVIGMIASAALLLIAPHSSEPGDQNFIDAWSWVLFGGVLVGSWRKVNPILLIVLSAVAGILIYHVF